MRCKTYLLIFVYLKEITARPRSAGTKLGKWYSETVSYNQIKFRTTSNIIILEKGQPFSWHGLELRTIRDNQFAKRGEVLKPHYRFQIYQT
jgi:hypothetical protein